MSSRPTAAMLARHCYPDVPPEAVMLRKVQQLNVKPASVVWRVELERDGESRTLFLKHCYGKRAALQTRLYKIPPEKLKNFQPTVPAIWRDPIVGGHWLAMEPLRKLPPYGGFKGREAVIRRLAAMQGHFFFARTAHVERAGLTWLPNFLRRVTVAHRRGSLYKHLKRHRRLLPQEKLWSKRLAMAIEGVPKLVSKMKRGPFALAHGDVHRGNLGLADDGSLRLIDWSRCTIAPLPFDLVYVVERALSRYPDYATRHRQYREWAINTYIKQLAEHGREVSRKQLLRQYEITFVLYSLVSSLWKRLRLMSDGDTTARHAVSYTLARIDEWGKKHGVIK